MAQNAKERQSLRSLEISRPRLHALFDDAIHNAFFVVTAGAGFGKTREVTAYLRQRDHQVAWLSLTQMDNLTSHFWETFTRAVANQHPKLAAKLTAHGFPDTLGAHQTFLRICCQELYATDRSVVFVLDNLHLIEAPQVKRFIALFLSAKLEKLCVILLTRYWPVLEQELHESHAIITGEQMQFSLEETVTLFGTNGLVVSYDEIAKVHAYTAGWPIALSMVVLALRKRQTPVADIVKTAKLPLFWLFEQEIFSQYAPDAQKLLILLSVLDSFPRGLVTAITSAKNQNVFQLVGNNPFIQYEIDSKRFYFQPLFLEYLREKLLSLSADDIDGVYLKAGDWCYDNGHHYNALMYYKQCRSYEDVWKTLLRVDVIRYPRRETELLIEVIQWLPEAFRQTRPMIAIVLSVLYANNLQFDEALRTIDEVMAELKLRKVNKKNRHLLGEAYVAQGLIHHAMERSSFADCFVRAAQLLPNGSRHWNEKLKIVELGPALQMESTARGALEKSVQGFVAAVPHMVHVLHGAGKGLDALVQCEFCFLTGDIGCAIEHAHKAVYEASQAEQFDIAGNALFMLLKTHNLRGDYLKMRSVFDQIEDFEKNPKAKAFGLDDISRTWFYAETGEFSRLSDWIMASPSDVYAPVSMGRELLVRARCLIAKGEEREALPLLNYHEEVLQNKKSYILLLYVAICRAIVHRNLGDQKRAFDDLLRAHQIAAENGIITPFVEYGNYLRPLLDRAIHERSLPIPQEWLQHVHSKCKTFSKRHTYLVNRYRRENVQSDARFNLSRRETELLQNLSQGLTRKEISESMGISVNTVKTMLRQIYTKLNAINSADAIRIALHAKII